MSGYTDVRSRDWHDITGVNGEVSIRRWPSEKPLLAVSIVVAVVLWIVIIVSIIGLVYGIALGVLFFIMHAIFVAHVRGNGVRLGPDQFPQLYARVKDLGRRLGIDPMPAAYVMQAGGALNAFATRFLRSYMIVLYTDLLDACGDNEAARDMIIGHELGHIRAGHLRWHWFLLPASLFPFLGGALSRAREYTCDRYGFASANDAEGALLGLSILAAGGRHGRLVNREALVRQRQDLNTGWMTIGQWLTTHPVLAKRLVALDPGLGDGRTASGFGGVMRALAILLLFLGPLSVLGWYGGRYVAETVEAAALSEQAAYAPPSTDAAMEQLEEAVAAISAFVAAELAQGRNVPGSYQELADRWDAANPNDPLPIDPFDGVGLGYYVTDTGYVLWSSGPDHEPDTGDDLEYTFSR